MDLNSYKKNRQLSGQPLPILISWILLGEPLVSSFLPGSIWRVLILRLFGADIGRFVNIKPRVRVKFPWKLSIGDHSWIGECVWIDNIDYVKLGSNVCISQGVYLCTGNHDYTRSSFDLITSPIMICSRAWVCAGAVIGPGAQVGEGGIVGLGCVFSGNLEPWTIASSPDNQLRVRRKKS